MIKDLITTKEQLKIKMDDLKEVDFYKIFWYNDYIKRVEEKNFLKLFWKNF